MRWSERPVLHREIRTNHVQSDNHSQTPSVRESWWKSTYSITRIHKSFAAIDTTHVLTEKSVAHRLGIGILRHFWFSEILRKLRRHEEDWICIVHSKRLKLRVEATAKWRDSGMAEPVVIDRAIDHRRTLTSFWSLLRHLPIMCKAVKLILRTLVSF